MFFELDFLQVHAIKFLRENKRGVMSGPVGNQRIINEQTREGWFIPTGLTPDVCDEFIANISSTAFVGQKLSPLVCTQLDDLKARCEQLLSGSSCPISSLPTPNIDVIGPTDFPPPCGEANIQDMPQDAPSHFLPYVLTAAAILVAARLVFSLFSRHRQQARPPFLAAPTPEQMF